MAGVVDITDTTDSSDATGDTGALRTEGGASIAKKLYVGTDLDVDGTTNLDVVDIDGAVDMASTLQVDGAITSSAGATITTADNTAQLTLISTDADANVGPDIILSRQSSSAADNDQVGSVKFVGHNDAGTPEDITYTQIVNFIEDATDGSEDGILAISSIVNGTDKSRLKFTGSEAVFNENRCRLDTC